MWFLTSSEFFQTYFAELLRGVFSFVTVPPDTGAVAEAEGLADCFCADWNKWVGTLNGALSTTGLSLSLLLFLSHRVSFYFPKKENIKN